MNGPARLCRALEMIPALAAVPAEWRRILGDDFTWVEQHLLRPTGELARTFPSSHGEPYRVIEHGAGRYRAVHAEGAPHLALTKSDITILRLDIVKFAQLLGRTFGFDAANRAQAIGDGRYRIGKWRVTPANACPVWLCIQPEQYALHDSLRHVLVEADGPFLVITPSALNDKALDRALTDHLACHVSLSDAVECDRPGSFRLLSTCERELRAFRRSAVTVVAATDVVQAGTLQSENDRTTSWPGREAPEEIDGRGMPAAPEAPRDKTNGPSSNLPNLDDERLIVSYAGISCAFSARRSLLYALLKRILTPPGYRVAFSALSEPGGPWHGSDPDDSTIRGAVTRLRGHLKQCGLEAVASAISTMTVGGRGYVSFDPAKLGANASAQDA